jgi:pullulanase
MANGTLSKTALALIIVAGACGGGGDGNGFDAAPPLPNTLKVHYHRPLADYAGWTLQTTAGAVEATASPGTPDGFGAVYSVTLASGAQAVAFTLVKDGMTDPAGPLTVDVSGTTREAWVISGWDEAITRPLPALPAENQVAIYYLRDDDNYSGWGLHVWGDQVTNTAWTAPVPAAGVDPGFGAGFLVDIVPGAAPGNCTPGNICLIVHKGDTKDPGPDMSFDPGTLGNLVFLLTGSSDITAKPRKVGDVGISGVAAHLLGSHALAWCLVRDGSGTCAADPMVTQAELRFSPTAAIKAVETDVTGGTVIPLTPRPGGLTADERLLAPYLAGATVWDIAAADRPTLLEATRGQMVAVARKGDGSAARATQVNVALYLDEVHAYDGPLGVTFAAGAPRFAVWAPTAQGMKLHVADAEKRALEGSPFEMTRGERGVWTHTAGPASWKGNYYRYEARVFHPLTGKVEDFVTTDPYAVNLSPNGLYAQIVDLADPALAPPGWDALVKPPLAAPEDIVLYETHIRDFSVGDPTTPAERRGKYLGFVTESGAQRSQGLAHLAALAEAGLTHVHLLPAFDIATVDEVAENRVDLDQPFARLCQRNTTVPAALCGQFPTQTIREALASLPGDSDQQQVIVGHLRGLDSFNWGYDPFHFGAPEGSYASTADGTAKIIEFRRMVQGLSAIGLRVIMDVVYNHTNAAGTSEKSVLDKLVPNYYQRIHPETGFVYSSSCCANTATEHRMMERLMIDTAVRFARDYKVDGLRFDLMGLHTKANILKVRDALAALTLERDGVDGSKIYLYGEGWDMGELPRSQRARQVLMAGTGIGTFNDRIRDGVRGGGPFDSGDDARRLQGFVTGLYVDPNELSSATEASRTRLAQLGDLVRMGMAGGLADFKLLTFSGSTLPAAAVGYGSEGQPAGYTQDPQEIVNYVSAHDNEALWDVVQLKLPTGTSTADRVRVHNLALDTILLGQGIPFLHMGDELLRSKSMDRNSYDSGDWYNLIDWSGQRSAWRTGLPPSWDNMGAWATIRKLFMDATTAPGPAHIAAASAHVKEMLRIRSSSRLFRLRTKEDVLERVDFHNGGPQQVPGVIVMTISDGSCAGADLDPERHGIIVVVNASKGGQTLEVAGASGATLHPVLQASADPVVRQASVSGSQVTVPARTTAVFQVPASHGAGASFPCNTR